MNEGPAPYSDECFFIAPIGKEGTDLRKRSDGVRDFIVKPAVADLGLTTLRADDLAKPGQITLQVIEHVLRAKAVVADLTGANANVFYELAVRHTAKLPVVLIAAEEEIDHLPFDIQQMRVIPFDHQDLASAAHAKDQITEHLTEALGGAVDSPIATVLNLEALEQGTSVERTLAELVTRVDDLSRATSALRHEVRRDRTRDSQSRTRRREVAMRDALDREFERRGIDYELTIDRDGDWQVDVRADNRSGTYFFPAPETVETAVSFASSVADYFLADLDDRADETDRRRSDQDDSDDAPETEPAK